MARTEYYLVDHSGRSVRTADDEDGQMIAWISEDLRPKLVESSSSGSFSIWLDRAIQYVCTCLTRAASDACLDKVSGPFKIRVSSVVWLEFTTSGHQSTCRNMACALMVASGISEGSFTLGHFPAGATVLPQNFHPRAIYHTLTEDVSSRLASLDIRPGETVVLVDYQCYLYYCRQEYIREVLLTVWLSTHASRPWRVMTYKIITLSCWTGRLSSQ
ncbi:uncharacterized protein BO96DRAFT_365291 [Aspergillus niger CBS 101883]|uniref:Uncharacterized protein n=2 Tax=Aspergillus niger TaxID=5061 RepID=A2QAS3_ASPNC|nr:uncharacterized protein BO96DRAFT_365291 [Aspergillus niger CBS 101883]XP_059599795.1 hypothetical protein An01g12560 [Aspergillus niger]PYH57378.1 hypothetical protein BO96DRAFT_365291 [Aspergillus niger CBS 101883]CAK37307.1 hypothetical protein An01g12560 [Aspergillus niger]